MTDPDAPARETEGHAPNDPVSLPWWDFKGRRLRNRLMEKNLARQAVETLRSYGVYLTAERGSRYRLYGVRCGGSSHASSAWYGIGSLLRDARDEEDEDEP